MSNGCCIDLIKTLGYNRGSKIFMPERLRIEGRKLIDLQNPGKPVCLALAENEGVVICPTPWVDCSKELACHLADVARSCPDKEIVLV